MINTKKPTSQEEISSDYTWAQRLAERDADVSKVLNDKIHDWVRMYLRQKLYWLSTAMVEEYTKDCAQDANERILSRLHLYTGRGSFLGWCKVIALNVAIDWIRSDMRARKNTPAQLNEAIIQLGDPIDKVERDIEMERISQHIVIFVKTELTERDKAIFYSNDTNTSELAASLEITETNLYQIRFRTLVKLRRYLETRGYTRQKLLDWGLF